MFFFYVLELFVLDPLYIAPAEMHSAFGVLGRFDLYSGLSWRERQRKKCAP